MSCRRHPALGGSASPRSKVGCRHGVEKSKRVRSPLLRKLGRGFSIASHESQGTEVLPELSAPTGTVECPRGAAEGARGHRRASPGATCRGEEGFLDILQAAVF